MSKVKLTDSGLTTLANVMTHLNEVDDARIVSATVEVDGFEFFMERDRSDELVMEVDA